MDVASALARLGELADGLDAESPDLVGLQRLAADAVRAAAGWTQAEAIAFRTALDEVIVEIEGRRDALGAELGGVARKGRAIRGYGRPMGVEQSTVAQRVCRRG